MTVKGQILEILSKNRSRPVSGEEMAGQLGCTRAAVWKAVKSLRKDGYGIEAAGRQGYILKQDTAKVTAEGLRLWLEHPDVTVHVTDETASTNLLAKQAAIVENAPHGSLFFARSQTDGRGRKGRAFFSPRDCGLYFSVVIRPEGSLEENLRITAAAASAVYRAVNRACGIRLGIKWVNDLFLGDRKVCGILTEAGTDFESQGLEYVVVGIGLNLFLNEEKLPGELKSAAGGLFASQEEAEKTDRNRLTAEIVNELLRILDQPGLPEDYFSESILPGKRILVTQQAGRSWPALAKKMLPDGRLLVEDEQGREHALIYGEVRIRKG